MTSINTSAKVTYDKTENGTPIIEKGKENNKDLFLELLVAQMKFQDPMNPQDPTQYVTQLSQFSMLEQTMSLNDGIKYLSELNNGILINSAMSTSSALIGKHVEVSEVDENKENYKGIVKSAHIKDGVVYMDIKLDGTDKTESFRYDTLLKISESDIEGNIK